MRSEELAKTTGLHNQLVVLKEEAKHFFGRGKDQLNDRQGIVGGQLSNGWYVDEDALEHYTGEVSIEDLL